jgi:hypothetical protein
MRQKKKPGFLQAAESSSFLKTVMDVCTIPSIDYNNMVNIPYIIESLEQTKIDNLKEDLKEIASTVLDNKPKQIEKFYPNWGANHLTQQYQELMSKLWSITYYAVDPFFMDDKFPILQGEKVRECSTTVFTIGQYKPQAPKLNENSSNEKILLPLPYGGFITSDIFDETTETIDPQTGKTLYWSITDYYDDGTEVKIRIYNK